MMMRLRLCLISSIAVASSIYNMYKTASNDHEKGSIEFDVKTKYQIKAITDHLNCAENGRIDETIGR